MHALLPLFFLSNKVIAFAVPTATAHERRDEQPPVPTYTLGPLSQYISAPNLPSEPSGDALQIYPTGILDTEDIPEAGIDVAFGPDLRKKIQDTLQQQCQDKSDDECRDALAPIIHNTDVSLHTKRLVVTLSAIFFALVINEIFVLAAKNKMLNNMEPPKAVKFLPDDLHQLHTIGDASTVALQTDAGGTAAPTTLTVHPPPTKTADELISMETLTADSGDNKKGDILYHVPETMAQRIQDFLGMMGVQEASRKCATQGAKRADTTEECARIIRNLARPLFDDDGPDQLMQMVPMNPAPPQNPPGGLIANVPVPHLVVEEVEVVVLLVRGLEIRHEIDIAELVVIARAALALAIVLHAVIFFGDALLQIAVHQDELAKDLEEEDFKCPEDLLCPDEICQGQKEGQDIASKDAVCSKGKFAMCKCKKVSHPYVYEVEPDYMDQQYAWLEELIERSNLPDIKPTCDQEKTEMADSAKKFEDKVGKACEEHAELRKRGELTKRNGDWTWTDTEDGYTWSLFWADKSDGECPFMCDAIFELFASDESCVFGDGLQKHGLIKTDCGEASYNTYKLGGL